MPYSLSAFGRLTSAKEAVSRSILEKGLPSIEEVKTLAKWNSDLLDLFNQPKPDDKPGTDKMDRSSALSRIAYFGAELGWSDEQIAAALYDADDRWEKYTSRKADTRANIILNMINRARQKHGYTPLDDITLSGLLQTQNKDVEISDNGKSKYVWGFQDFLDADFKIEWMLEGLFPMEGLGIFVAHPGVGKTTLAIQLAATLALGHERFLTWHVNGAPRKVMFLSFEMAGPPLHLFLSNIAENYSDRNTLNRNFLVAPLGEPLPLNTEAGQAFLNNLLDEFMPDVIFIDSLQMISSEALTDEQAVKTIMQYLSTIRAKYKTAVLLIHHNRKKPNDAQKKAVEQSDVYGSTYIIAAADFVLNLHEVTEDVLMLTTFKNRLGPTKQPFEITRDDHLTFTMDFEGMMQNFGKGGDNDSDNSLLGI